MIVGIFPEANSPLREWPLDYFAELVQVIDSKTNLDIEFHLIGRRKSTIEDFEKMLKLSQRNIRYKTLINEPLNLVFPNLDFCISNISGPAHYAAFFKIPSICIYSGTQSISEWSPASNKSVLVYKDVDCSPCLKNFFEECHNEFKCMLEISPHKVYEIFCSMIVKAESIQ